MLARIHQREKEIYSTYKKHQFPSLKKIKSQIDVIAYFNHIKNDKKKLHRSDLKGFIFLLVV